MSFIERLKNSWNVFTSNEQVQRQGYYEYGRSTGYGTDRRRLSYNNERSIVNSVITRMAVDVSAFEFLHVRVSENDQFEEEITSHLNECLTVEANIDQSASAFKLDVALTLLDKGYLAIVPVETTANPLVTGGYDILSMRVGEIVEWLPRAVRVRVYDDRPDSGEYQEVLVPKRNAAIVYNPLASIMNEPNSTLQRLASKLNLLDKLDSENSSGKLDLIIQLPYSLRSETKKQQAAERRKEIEYQLKDAKYGIAYVDATERITQLNRPAENNLWAQATDLTNMLYSHFGITEEVLNGTADEAVMLNYLNRTVKPIVKAIAEEMNRKFLTKTARTQRQRIVFYKDPFELVPVGSIAEIADKFTRNEILTGNEIRGIIGFRPSKDPKAEELRNSNLSAPSEGDKTNPLTDQEESESQNGT